MESLLDLPFKDNWSYIAILSIGIFITAGVIINIPNKLGAGLVGSILLLVFVFSLVLIFQSYSLPTEKTNVINWLKTFDMLPLSLIPIGFFIAGPIIDIINQQYKYSIPSGVALVTSMLVAVLGSSGLADISGTIFDTIYSAFSLDGRGIAAVVAAIALFAVPPLAMNWTIGPSYARGYSSIMGVLYGLIMLSGTGFLGKRSTEAEITARTNARAARSGLLAASRAARGPEEPLLRPGNPFGGSKFTYESRNVDGRVDPDKCDVPGFTWLSNNLAPISIVISQTVIWCHLFESFVNSNSGNTITLGITAGVTLLLQFLSLELNSCLFMPTYRYGRASVLIALVASVLGAVVSYYSLKSLTSEGFTSDQTTQKQGIFSNPPPDAPPKPDGSVKIKVGSASEKNLPVNDEDQFVCEAYKDGELITSTIIS